jgi:hypothetical protein
MLQYNTNQILLVDTPKVQSVHNLPRSDLIDDQRHTTPQGQSKFPRQPQNDHGSKQLEHSKSSIQQQQPTTLNKTNRRRRRYSISRCVVDFLYHHPTPHHTL